MSRRSHEVSAAPPSSPPVIPRNTAARGRSGTGHLCGGAVVEAGSPGLPVTPWLFRGASSLSLICKVGGYDLPHKFVLRLK